MDRLKSVRILYVDDEEFVRQNAIEYLSLYCDYVFGAKDGIEAYEMYMEIKPDIIISDIKMPKLNGIDLAKKIRQKDKKTKIIIATAFLDTNYLLDSIELGLVKYLIKPISQDKLIPVLKSCLDDIVEKSSIFYIDDKFIFDIFNNTLFYKDKQIDLAKKELLVLSLLIKNHKRAVKFEEFNSYVWYGDMSLDALRTVIRELRNKIKKDAIKSISSIGYQIATQKVLDV